MPSNPGKTIREGFQVLKEFPSFDRPLKGITIVSLVDENRENRQSKQYILTWDSKGIYMWDNIKLYKKIKFPKLQQNFISCLSYISKLGVFFAPALDMSFKIYDNNLHLIESIHHEERAIIDCSYDRDKDVLILSGASGVSIWKILHNSQNLTNGTFILEKLFTIDGCDHWVTKMIHEPKFKRIYALIENSIEVCDLRSRSVKIRLHEIHEAPVTCVCWYGIDQYYITACSRGQVSCWSPRPSQNKQQQQQFLKSNTFNTINTINNNNSNNNKPPQHTLLHSFLAHSKAVTGMTLHPTPGMLITAGLDGYIKVWDLEIYSQLQSISLEYGITQFRVTQYNGYDICLIGMTNGSAEMWRINSCCSEFRLCASDVTSLNGYDSFIQLDRLIQSPVKYYEHDEIIPQSEGINDNLNENNNNNNNQKNDGNIGILNESELIESRPFTALPPTLASLENSFQNGMEINSNNNNNNNSNSNNNGNFNTNNNNNKTSEISNSTTNNNDKNKKNGVIGTISIVVSAPLNQMYNNNNNNNNNNNPNNTSLPQTPYHQNDTKKSRPSTQSHINYDIRLPSREVSSNLTSTSSLERSIIAFAGNDLQIISPSGQIKSRVEPDALVEGVIMYCFSVFQQLLFCLLENSHIRIFCTKSSTCVLLREIYIGAIGSDIPSVLLLTDEIISISPRTSSTSKDMRGNPSPLNFEETLVIGTSSGTMICLDTFQECQMIAIHQIFQGKIESLKYRRHRQELIGLGYSFTSPNKIIRVWSVPHLTMMYEINCDSTFSCWEISQTFSFICVGCNDGFCRLFTLVIDTLMTNNDNGNNNSNNNNNNNGLSKPQTPNTLIEGVNNGDIVNIEEKNLPIPSIEIPKGRHIEVLKQEGGHESEILCISFCDDLRVYATSSLDCTIKFWDYEKRAIKSILFNSPCQCLLFSIPAGDILITQGRYVSIIKKDTWEEKGLIQAARDADDPWDLSGLPDETSNYNRGIQLSRDKKVNSAITSLPTLYDSTTFLTEDQRINMELNLNEYGITNDFGTNQMNIMDYWKYNSSLGDLTRKKNHKDFIDYNTGIEYNVRKPIYRVKVKESKKRFATKLKEREIESSLMMTLDDNGDYNDNNNVDGNTYDNNDNHVNNNNNNNNNVNINENGEIFGIENNNEDNQIDNQDNRKSRITGSILKRSGTIIVSPKSRQRNAFVRAARVVRTTVSINKNFRKTTVQSETNDSSGRLTQFKPVPPSNSMSSAINSLLQHQKLNNISDGIQDIDNRQIDEYSESYHVKPNGRSSNSTFKQLKGRKL